MALERYVQMRKAYENEQQERQEPHLGSLEDEDIDIEQDGEAISISALQKVLMVISVLFVVVACLMIDRTPIYVLTQYFSFGANVPSRVIEILAWNKLWMALPILLLLVSFWSFRSTSFAGVRIMMVAIISGVLVTGVAGIFTYFIASVAA